MIARRVCEKLINFKYFHLHLAKQEYNITKMRNAYLRLLDGGEQFSLTFQFSLDSLGVSRQFNFNRKITESVDDFVGRVGSSVDKILDKKRRKKKKKSEGTSEETEKIDVQVLYNGIPVPGNAECGKILLRESEIIIRVMGMDYRVIVNAPWVNNIALPSCIMAGFPVYPCKLETFFADTSVSIFNWYKNVNVPAENAERSLDDPEKWEILGTGFYYTPASTDIGHKLKLRCIPKNDISEGPSVDVLSKNPVEAAPGVCPFEQRHLFTSERLIHKNFRVVSYNILAGLYSDSDVARTQLFAHCPPYALDIEYRKQLILKELLGYNGDIICLQEVDAKVFEYDLVPVLSSVGYEGIFHRKGGGSVGEGVACFYHKTKFRILDSHSTILAEELKSNPLFKDLLFKISSNTAFRERMLERTTSLQCVFLESAEEPGKGVIVGNTHFYFHPNADHIRLLQGCITISYLEDYMARCLSLHEGLEMSLLLCGDFNSTPDCGVYCLMTTGNVSDQCIDWRSKEDEAVTDVSFSHSLHLSSACGTPAFTNYTVGFNGCLDYIFYDTDKLDVTQVVPLPTEEEVTLHVALPNVVFPSDHLALVADMKWKQ